jgi:hypothetical protein
MRTTNESLELGIKKTGTETDLKHGLQTLYEILFINKELQARRLCEILNSYSPNST